MDAAQTEKLKALALAATPGPWHVTKYCSVMDEGMNTLVVSSDSSHEDRDFIAAANPATVLDLIADNERLRDELAESDSALRAEPAGCVFLAFANLTDEKIAEICVHIRPANFTYDDGAIDYLGYDAAVVRAVGTKLATRCRAEGGGTNCNSSNSSSSCSAPAAGTDKDAERYRWLRDRPEIPDEAVIDVAIWKNCAGTSLRGEELDRSIDAAIVAHTSAGEAQA